MKVILELQITSNTIIFQRTQQMQFAEQNPLKQFSGLQYMDMQNHGFVYTDHTQWMEETRQN